MEQRPATDSLPLRRVTPETLPKTVSANISGLTASTTYHFRIVATNSAGTRYGSDRTFTTLPPTGFPIVTTKPATNVATSCGDTQWFTRSAWVDHERLFPIWHHDQLRAHHAYAESDWKHLPEYCCQHRWPGWEYYLSFSNCSYQQCRHQVRQRQDLYHAVATSDNHESGNLRRSYRSVVMRTAIKQSHTRRE